jgi:undecaprenyl diphosphate synthase
MQLIMAGEPQHVAIIMDGNGRWVRSRGLPRPAGHRASVRVVRRVVEECATSAQLAAEADA